MSGQGSHGFTLVEVLVVLALVGVITALGLPRMGPALARAQLRASEEALADLLVEARDRAMAERHCMRVEVDTDRAVIKDEGSRCDPSSPRVERASLSLIAGGLESVRVEVAGRAVASIAFDALGRLAPEAGQSTPPARAARVALFARGVGERGAIAILPTGLVVVERAPRERAP